MNRVIPMPRPKRNDDELGWVGAEGIHEDIPVLIRAREVPSNVIKRLSFPYLLTAILTYDPSDETGLPSSTQYRKIGRFERRVLDPLELQEQGIVAFIATWNGSVTYSVYLKDGEQAPELFARHLKATDCLEYQVEKDKVWSRYKE